MDSRGDDSKRSGLTQEQRFGLAVSALLTELNGEEHDILEGGMPGEEIMKDAREALREWWRVEERSDLLGLLSWLLEEGDREECEEGKDNPSSMLAWDLCRLVTAARWGAGAEYLSRDEAWDWIEKSARRIRESFVSWAEMGESFLDGYLYWSEGRSDIYDEELDDIFNDLLDPENEESPWNRVPWE